ncbi:MAG TPA: hemolysin III family protein [Firmicutes bacterium]|nr:hemolysin III family protein [Bacillota bacterium]
MKNKRRQTLGEEITNAVLHGVGFGLAVAALTVLVVFANKYGNVWHVVGFAIFGATLVLLYLSSTLYHSLPEGKAKRVFRIFDHSSIFLLIAGTYTPITLIKLRGGLGWTIFGMVWGIAILGIISKVFWINKFSILSTILYLVMGWLVVVALKPLLAALNRTSTVFLVTGGLLYTVGTIFYSWKKIKYTHAIWHLFVLAGSVCHFFTVLFLLPS